MNVVVFSRVAALYQAVLKQCKGVQSVKFQYAAPEDPAGEDMQVHLTVV